MSLNDLNRAHLHLYFTTIYNKIMHKSRENYKVNIPFCNKKHCKQAKSILNKITRGHYRTDIQSGRGRYQRV